MVIKPNQGEADGLAHVRKDVLVERFSKLNRRWEQMMSCPLLVLLKLNWELGRFHWIGCSHFCESFVRSFMVSNGNINCRIIRNCMQHVICASIPIMHFIYALYKNSHI